VREELQQLGWEVLTVWECEAIDEKTLSATLREFLGDAVC
jgi:G:T-mismatch repair DNA endonuclease (very short patch repair protein)